MYFYYKVMREGEGLLIGTHRKKAAQARYRRQLSDSLVCADSTKFAEIPCETCHCILASLLTKLPELGNYTIA